MNNSSKNIKNVFSLQTAKLKIENILQLKRLHSYNVNKQKKKFKVENGLHKLTLLSVTGKLFLHHCYVLDSQKVLGKKMRLKRKISNSHYRLHPDIGTECP